MTAIIAVSGWRGFVGFEDHLWIDQQLTLLGTLFGGEDLYWRVGDEPDGTDAEAFLFLTANGLDVCRYKADWSLPNKAGGPVRSLHMLQGKSHLDRFEGCKADLLIAFPQPGKRVPKHEEVSGTWTCIELAKRYGITFIVPGYTKTDPERLF